MNKEDIETQIKPAEITKENTGDVVIKLNNDNKSILKIGNIKIYSTKKLNWLQRKRCIISVGSKINKGERKGEE